MNRLGALCLVTAAVVLPCILYSPATIAQTKEGAILLLPESDLDQELAEDLTEVLIASLIDKSGKNYRIIGKEVFRKAVSEAQIPGGECTTGFNLDCFRKVGQDKALNLVVVGRVGKAMGGFRLEVFKLSTTGLPDRTQRKRVPGELEQLIAEVESLADWILQPDHPYLKVSVSEPEAQVTVDGQPYTTPAEPLRVTPGVHTVEATKEGFAAASKQVTCEVDSYCSVDLALVKLPEPVPDKTPTGDAQTKEPKVVEPENPHRYLPWAIASGSVALLSGLGAGYFFLSMESYKSDIDDIKDEYCPAGTCTLTRAQFKDLVDPKVESGNDAAIGATALGVVAIAAGVGAVVLLVLDLTDTPVLPTSDEASAFTLLPVAGPEAFGFQLGFSF